MESRLTGMNENYDALTKRVYNPTTGQEALMPIENSGRSGKGYTPKASTTIPPKVLVKFQPKSPKFDTTVRDYVAVEALGKVYCVRESDLYFKGSSFDMKTKTYGETWWENYAYGYRTTAPGSIKYRRRLDDFSHNALSRIRMLADEEGNEYLLDLVDELVEAEADVRADERVRYGNRLMKKLDAKIAVSKLLARTPETPDGRYYHGGRLTALYESEEIIEGRSL